MLHANTRRDGESERQVRATGPSGQGTERQGTKRLLSCTTADPRVRPNVPPLRVRECAPALAAPARARLRAGRGPAALPLRCEGEGERRAMTIWKVWLTERRSRSWASWKDGLDGGGRDDDGLEGGKGGGQHGSELHVDGRVVDRGGGGDHRSYCLRRQGH